MQVIPSINVSDADEAREKIALAKKFLPRSGGPARRSFSEVGSEGGLHIDVGDGIFASIKNWGDPVELRQILDELDPKRKINTEVHLMVENPEDIVKHWLKAEVKRIIVHLESVKNSAYIMKLCEKAGVEFMLAINPETIVENLIPYFHNVKYFLILGVIPGKSGQKFQESVLEKIMFLRERLADVKIEVDGGVDIEVAKKAKKAGADIIVTASYIWNSGDPVEAYNKLSAV